MSLTRGQLITRVQTPIGDTSTKFSTYLQGSFDKILDYFWDFHDWNFRHKSSSFATVGGTESYDLSISTPDLRSSEDIETMYDTTQGRFLQKVDLRDIRKRFPKEDQNSTPTIYAPWGTTTVFLSAKPIDVSTIKFLYLAKATHPTSDSDDIETVCKVPSYCHYVLEQLLLAEGYAYADDDRRQGLLAEIHAPKLGWMTVALQADMRHMETGARFKFWEEELAASGRTFDDFLRYTWLKAGY